MKTQRVVLVSVVVASLTIVSVPLRANDALPVATQQTAREIDQAKAPTITLKLTVVISRFENDKKVGSLPFVLMVVPGADRDGEATSLQMGSEVPVVQTTGAASSYTYRSVGTNISTAAKVVDEGRFNVFVTVQDSQVMRDPAQGGIVGAESLPRFQSFRSTNRLLLRDGQTVQYTAATDKTSGEVIKLDVTLNVIK